MPKMFEKFFKKCSAGKFLEKFKALPEEVQKASKRSLGDILRTFGNFTKEVRKTYKESLGNFLGSLEIFRRKLRGVRDAQDFE